LIFHLVPSGGGPGTIGPPLIIHFVSHYTFCFSFPAAAVKEQLAAFHRMDADGDGHLTVEEFEKGLGVTEPPNELIRHLFRLLDVNESGLLDFREYTTLFFSTKKNDYTFCFLNIFF
jgi:hypothetical protein